MFHKRLARLVLAGLIAAGAAVSAVATPASAAPVVAELGCRFILAEVRANALQEAPADETFMRIGAEYTKSVKFREQSTHLAFEFGNLNVTSEFIPLNGSITVAVWEDDWPSANDLLGAFGVFCTPGHYTEVVDNFGSFYVIVFDVIVA